MTRHPKSILMIEDNPGDVLLVRELLEENEGINPDLCDRQRLADGLAWLEENTADLILLDLNLPDSNGLETFGRTYDSAGGLPIIVLSGLQDQDTAIKTLQMGAQDYLVKGHFDGNGLMRAIHYAIERKRLQNELVNARKWESIALMTGGIAHDFNNLYTIIMGYIELATDFISSDNQARDCLKEAVAACKSAKALTNQLIAFTRQGKSSLQIQRITENLLNLTCLVSNNPKIGYTFDVQPELWPVVCDWEQLQQVFASILENAVEAMPEGGSITVSARNLETHDSAFGIPAGRYVAIRITDTGKGIQKEKQPKVFDPYFSTKERGAQKGMGLGLTIARAIINAHAGRLYIDSMPDKGTTAHIYLPTG